MVYWAIQNVFSQQEDIGTGSKWKKIPNLNVYVRIALSSSIIHVCFDN